LNGNLHTAITSPKQIPHCTEKENGHAQKNSTDCQRHPQCPHHRAVAHDAQDIFFRNTPSRQSGLVLREGQSFIYDLVRAPGGEWMVANIEIVEERPLN